jgi:hypothetical protein
LYDGNTRIIFREKGVSRRGLYAAYYKHVRVLLRVNGVEDHGFITVGEAGFGHSANILNKTLYSENMK